MVCALQGRNSGAQTLNNLESGRILGTPLRYLRCRARYQSLVKDTGSLVSAPQRASKATMPSGALHGELL